MNGGDHRLIFPARHVGHVQPARQPFQIHQRRQESQFAAVPQIQIRGQPNARERDDGANARDVQMELIERRRVAHRSRRQRRRVTQEAREAMPQFGRQSGRVCTVENHADDDCEKRQDVQREIHDRRRFARVMPSLVRHAVLAVKRHQKRAERVKRGEEGRDHRGVIQTLIHASALFVRHPEQRILSRAGRRCRVVVVLTFML